MAAVTVLRAWQMTHLRGACCGAAEVTWSVIAVSLMLRLQAYALAAVHCHTIIVNTADSAVHDPIAT